MPSKVKKKKIGLLSGLTPAEVRTIAKEAYIYGFPLVDNYRIQYSYFVDQNNPEYKGPFNRVHNTARVYTPEDKAVQSPNSDTPYSFIGADLRTEPLVLTMPEVKQRRYYSAQFIDMYTFNFAYVGSRATGNSEGNFLLAGPDWKGRKPVGIKEVIHCETQLAFVLYRTQLFNPEDIARVRKIQAGYSVQPLSQYLGRPAPLAAPKIVFVKPLSPEEQRTSPEFFSILNFVLQFCPTHPSETELRERFGLIGISAGKQFDVQGFAPEMRKAIKDGIKDAWKTFTEFKEQKLDSLKVVGGDMVGSRKFVKNNYLYRMVAAVLGIYGNSKEEAMYPVYFVDATGQKPDGSKHRYTLRFAPGRLPPVNAFWSLTLYELPESLLYANPVNRYLINSAMLPDLKKDADGGITLYIQHESPGKDKESNWLPAPAGHFFCALRLYWPKKEAADGTWKQPPLEKAGIGTTVLAQTEPASASGYTLVTPDNFKRAESDMYFTVTAVKEGAFGRFNHRRQLFSVDDQTVVRGNRDTLYSSGVFDLNAGPVTITLPDAGNRFMSLMVLNEDHFAIDVKYDAGSYTFTREQVGTRYVLMAVRTLVDPNNPSDIKEVHRLQDAIKINQPGGPGKFEMPQWDQQSQEKVRQALTLLGETMPDFTRAFGKREEVDPVKHLIGTAIGWGGNPDKDARYLNITPAKNDGKTIYRLTVNDVPVDAFWSISVYNDKGFFEKNPYDVYSLNSLTAEKNEDGFVTIQFGGYDGKIPNCLPITPGWNYTVRLYHPRSEVLNGTWKFPEARPVS
jgi:hypothetical protein